MFELVAHLGGEQCWPSVPSRDVPKDDNSMEANVLGLVQRCRDVLVTDIVGAKSAARRIVHGGWPVRHGQVHQPTAQAETGVRQLPPPTPC